MSTILPQQDSAHLRYSNEVQLVAASLTCRSRPHRYHTQHQKWPLRAKAVTLFSYKWARNKVHSSTMAAHKAVPTLHAHRYAWCYLQARTLVVVKEPRKGAEKPALALWTDHTGRGCGHKGARSNQHPAHWAGGWATPGAVELTGRVATNTRPLGRATPYAAEVTNTGWHSQHYGWDKRCYRVRIRAARELYLMRGALPQPSGQSAFTRVPKFNFVLKATI